MSGADILREIYGAVHRHWENEMRAPREAWVTPADYSLLMQHVRSQLPVDIHEAAGDYDRPSSPWYGSRPSDTGFTALKLATPHGSLNVRVLANGELVVK